MSERESSLPVQTRIVILLLIGVHFAVLAAMVHFGSEEILRLSADVNRLTNIVIGQLDADGRLALQPVCEPEAGDIIHVNGMGYFQLTDPKDYIQAKLVCEHRYEWEVLDLIEKHAKIASTVVDAGAYIGTHTLVMARSVGPEGHVYSFEPVASVADQIRRNVQLNGLTNVSVVGKALGNATTAGFMLDPGRVQAKACTLDDIENGKLGCNQENVARDAPFEMVRLDDFELQNVSLLKIDVEGHEMDVLKGGRQTIEREKPIIIIEVWEDVRRAALGNTRDEVLRYIEGLGYGTEQLDGRNYLAVPNG